MNIFFKYLLKYIVNDIYPDLVSNVRIILVPYPLCLIHIFNILLNKKTTLETYFTNMRSGTNSIIFLVGVNV